MHLSLTMRSIVGIILVLISSTLITIYAEKNDQHSDNTDNKEESNRSSLCDLFGVNALGMESGVIPDSAISSSSSYNEQSTGSKLARFNQDKSGGAWCPQQQLNADTSGREWIQVNLQVSHVVTGVATQGRFGNGYGVEFVEEYWIEYSRDNGSVWHRWKNAEGNHLLDGNTDTYTAVEHDLDLPIVGATLIRIVPFSRHLRTVCLRFELYGCPYDGPISYSMPNGIKGSRFGDLTDITYDGVISDSGYLLGGVGQLVDGVKGHDNYKINKGFEWVGWRKTNETLDIVFEFQNLRNFTTTTINCQNSFTKEVRVFSSAMIWFSIDNIKWSNIPIKFSYQSDNTLERPRDVIIHLQYRIGRFVKMSFKLASRWLHISEITFDSQSLVNSSVNISEIFEYEDNIELKSDFILNNKSLSPMTTQDNDQSAMKYSLLIITLVTLGVVVLMVSSSFMMRAYHNRKGSVFREISDTDIESENVTVTLKDLPKITSPPYCDPKDMSNNDDDNEYAVPDVICANGKSKSLQMPSSKAIITNPRYYASSEIIRSKHSMSDIKYPKQVLNIYETTANYSQQMPLLTTFMATKNQRQGSFEEQIHHFSESDIFLINKIGKSKFGDVMLGKMTKLRELVIVKSLNNITLKTDFISEMKFLCHLSQNCDKFAKLFGILDTNDCFAMIIEHGDCDLNEFLRECDPNVINYGALIYMASEIANGCNHLESMGQTHRDLSARNCLIHVKNLVIKLTDSGANRDKYQNDYYNGMPIRWMSPESILHGHFSSKSDVYSFSVTFWEILTYCKSRPHYDISDETLLRIIINGSNNSADSLLLSRPHQCPKEIYDLMVECWQTNENSRPPFHEIGLFLQRKNLGYQKPDQ